MAEKSEFELVVSQGNRPLWSRIIAAVFFTMMLIAIIGTVISFFSNNVTEALCLEAAKSVKGIAFCLAGGIYFSITKTILIDTDSNKLISRFCVGPFSRDNIAVVPILEYVAVFKNTKKEMFEVNLWYKGNKHYKMYAFEEKAPAMDFATKVAARLQLDLLDATEKGNSKWIETASK